MERMRPGALAHMLAPWWWFQMRDRFANAIVVFVLSTTSLRGVLFAAILELAASRTSPSRWCRGRAYLRWLE